jgi:hypothetical protein
MHTWSKSWIEEYKEESENEHWSLAEWLDEDRLASIVVKLFPRSSRKAPPAVGRRICI